jgi:prevent-host-death family protein
MTTANIAELKNHLSEYLRIVEKGEQVEIAKRNIPFAVISPLPKERRNKTKLGSARGSVQVLCDLTQPAMDDDEWEMLKG